MELSRLLSAIKALEAPSKKVLGELHREITAFLKAEQTDSWMGAADQLLETLTAVWPQVEVFGQTELTAMTSVLPIIRTIIGIAEIDEYLLLKYHAFFFRCAKLGLKNIHLDLHSKALLEQQQKLLSLYEILFFLFGIAQVLKICDQAQETYSAIENLLEAQLAKWQQNVHAERVYFFTVLLMLRLYHPGNKYLGAFLRDKKPLYRLDAFNQLCQTVQTSMSTKTQEPFLCIVSYYCRIKYFLVFCFSLFKAAAERDIATHDDYIALTDSPIIFWQEKKGFETVLPTMKKIWQAIGTLLSDDEQASMMNFFHMMRKKSKKLDPVEKILINLTEELFIESQHYLLVVFSLLSQSQKDFFSPTLADSLKTVIFRLNSMQSSLLALEKGELFEMVSDSSAMRKQLIGWLNHIEKNLPKIHEETLFDELVDKEQLLKKTGDIICFDTLALLEKVEHYLREVDKLSVGKVLKQEIAALHFSIKVMTVQKMPLFSQTGFLTIVKKLSDVLQIELFEKMSENFSWKRLYARWVFAEANFNFSLDYRNANQSAAELLSTFIEQLGAIQKLVDEDKKIRLVISITTLKRIASLLFCANQVVAAAMEKKIAKEENLIDHLFFEKIAFFLKEIHFSEPLEAQNIVADVLKKQEALSRQVKKADQTSSATSESEADLKFFDEMAKNLMSDTMAQITAENYKKAIFMQDFFIKKINSLLSVPARLIDTAFQEKVIIFLSLLEKLTRFERQQNEPEKMMNSFSKFENILPLLRTSYLLNWYLYTLLADMAAESFCWSTASRHRGKAIQLFSENRVEMDFYNEVKARLNSFEEKQKIFPIDLSLHVLFSEILLGSDYQQMAESFYQIVESDFIEKFYTRFSELSDLFCSSKPCFGSALLFHDWKSRLTQTGWTFLKMLCITQTGALMQSQKQGMPVHYLLAPRLKTTLAKTAFFYEKFVVPQNLPEVYTATFWQQCDEHLEAAVRQSRMSLLSAQSDVYVSEQSTSESSVETPVSSVETVSVPAESVTPLPASTPESSAPSSVAAWFSNVTYVQGFVVTPVLLPVHVGNPYLCFFPPKPPELPAAATDVSSSPEVSRKR